MGSWRFKFEPIPGTSTISACAPSICTSRSTLSRATFISLRRGINRSMTSSAAAVPTSGKAWWSPPTGRVPHSTILPQRTGRAGTTGSG